MGELSLELETPRIQLRGNLIAKEDAWIVDLSNASGGQAGMAFLWCEADTLKSKFNGPGRDRWTRGFTATREAVKVVSVDVNAAPSGASVANLGASKEEVQTTQRMSEASNAKDSSGSAAAPSTPSALKEELGKEVTELMEVWTDGAARYKPSGELQGAGYSIVSKGGRSDGGIETMLQERRRNEEAEDSTRNGEVREQTGCHVCGKEPTSRRCQVCMQKTCEEHLRGGGRLPCCGRGS